MTMSKDLLSIKSMEIIKQTLENQEDLVKNHEDIIASLNGKLYRWDEKNQGWRTCTPKGKFRAGETRKELPMASLKGLNSRGGPKKRNRDVTLADALAKAADKKDLTKKARGVMGELTAELTVLEEKKKALELSLIQQEEKLAKTKALEKMIATSPSAKDMQKAVLTMFEEKNFNPIASMVDLVQNGDENGEKLPMKEYITVLKALADFYPKPKTLDVTAQIDSTTTFIVQDFKKPIKQTQQVRINAESGEALIVNPKRAEDPAEGPVFAPEDYDDILNV